MRPLPRSCALSLLLVVPQVSGPGADDAGRNGRVLVRLQEALAESYVHPGAEAWLIESLRRNATLGSYDGLDTTGLGGALTGHLRGWTGDEHFVVAHLPALAAELEAAAAEPSSDEPPRDDPEEARAHFGVGRTEMLDDEVGLIRLDSIAFSPGTVAAFQEALASLPRANALLLDLRDNGGGSGDTVTRLVSCFFPAGERVELGTRYWRPDDEEVVLATDPELGGVRYLEHPVVVLTSEDTRSAAEALAYHLRAFGRAWVVGEATGGGAHSADMVSLGDGFVALIPMGRTTSARTGTDWEGRGVPVDVPCPAEEAEAAGHDLALRLLDL